MRKYHLLAISFSLTIPHVPVKFAYINNGSGLAKDSINLQDSNTRFYEDNVFAIIDQLTDLEMKGLAAWKNIFHGNRVVKSDATVRETPHLFLTHQVCIAVLFIYLLIYRFKLVCYVHYCA